MLYCFLILWAKNFRTFGEKISAWLSKLHYTGPEELFEEKYFLWENFIFFISFADIEWNILAFFVKFFWQDCQNCILRVQRNSLGENISFEKVIVL